MRKALHPRDVSRKEWEKDSIALRTGWMHQYSRITLKRAKKNQLQQLEPREQQEKLENGNRKKNNCMDISSEKQGRFHSRRHEHGCEMENLREELNLF